MYSINKYQHYSIEQRTFVDGHTWWCIMRRWTSDNALVGKGFAGKYRTYRAANDAANDMVMAIKQ